MNRLILASTFDKPELEMMLSSADEAERRCAAKAVHSMVLLEEAERFDADFAEVLKQYREMRFSENLFAFDRKPMSVDCPFMLVEVSPEEMSHLMMLSCRGDAFGNDYPAITLQIASAALVEMAEAEHLGTKSVLKKFGEMRDDTRRRTVLSQQFKYAYQDNQ